MVSLYYTIQYSTACNCTLARLGLVRARAMAITRAEILLRAIGLLCVGRRV